MAKEPTKPIDQMTEEELRREILAMQYERERMELQQSHAKVVKYDETQRQLVLRNEQRQADLETVRRRRERRQSGCRHKQGGKHQNIFRGDGKSAVFGALMLDGVTLRLYCQRCEKTCFTPNPELKKLNPKQYKKEVEEFGAMLEGFEDSGNELIRGPEFQFKREGIPFIPERPSVA